jgi:hypothetical protein
MSGGRPFTDVRVALRRSGVSPGMADGVSRAALLSYCPEFLDQLVDVAVA